MALAVMLWSLCRVHQGIRAAEEMDLMLVLGKAAAFRTFDRAESSRDGERVKCVWSPFLSQESHEEQTGRPLSCRVIRGG